MSEEKSDRRLAEINEEIIANITESIKREQHILIALTSATVPMDPITSRALMAVAAKIHMHYCSGEE